jgi:uncharacterized ubiquitin-like protein YukD
MDPLVVESTQDKKFDAKVEAYSTIKNAVENFLESELEDFFDGPEKVKTISKNGITITIDITQFKSE